MKTQFIKNITLLLAICVPALLFAQEPSEPKPAAEVVKATFENSMFINNQTVQTHDKGFLDVAIQHRFGVANEVKDLYGIYAPSNIRLYIGYGVTKDLSIGIGSTKSKQLYDFSWKYAILRQKTSGMPVSITYFGNIGATTVDDKVFLNQDNKNKNNDRLSYYNEIMVACKINKKISVQAGVNYTHYNMVDSASLYNHHDLYGFTAIGRYKFSPQGSFMVEYNLPLNVSDIDMNPKNITGIPHRPMPNLGFGVEFSTGYHQFQIFLCNTNGILSQEAKAYNYNDFTNTSVPAWLLGFNITRQFGFGD